MTGTGDASAPRVFTIPPGVPFLDTFARALLRGEVVPGFAYAGDPLALAGATILVPTRRSARALAATLAAAIDAPALLLPRIVPLSALEALETDLLFDEAGPGVPDLIDLPDAVAPTARRLILTRLILGWAAAVRRAVVSVEADGTRTLHPHEELVVASSAADAWSLAGDLATLTDDLIREGVDWGRLKALVTETFDPYWRITLDFLGIVMRAWPAILAERGEVDGARRQIALVEAEVARLGRGAPGPVVVAGAVGSSPAAARLIGAVARLREGAVVLPGLDTVLDARAWAAVGADTATHPQAALKHLIEAMGVAREDVRVLGEPDPGRAGRALFVSQALRPAGTTESWHGYATRTLPLVRAAALAGVSVVEAPNEREEALALALTLREALEGPGTAMLVTPDLALGRRVREELARWSIDIDVSAGEPLGTTPAGALARLVLDVSLRGLAPVDLLALLAHPYARFGRPRAEVAALARTLEVAALRGVLPAGALADPGALMDRVRAARDARHAPEPLRRLEPRDLDRLAAFLTAVMEALDPLLALGADTPLPDWLAAHEAVAGAVAARPDGDGDALGGIDGRALTALFDALAEAPQEEIRLDAPGYSALFDRFAAEVPVRGPDRSHPRVKILGLLEARLLTADLVLLGGLDEGVWPPPARTDAFLNRPMRASLGLPPPERRIGQTAHDLSMLMGAPRVVLSYPAKRAGTPTVPSRFLLRMAALAGDAWDAARARGRAVLALAEALDRPVAVRPVSRPAPAPPLALRPERLSVTRIETLRRDPYAIFAEYVLRLVPADPVGAAFGPREWGTLFHDVIAGFTRNLALGGPAGATALIEATERAFAEACADPQFRAFTLPRILGWAGAYHAWHGARGADYPSHRVEARGRLKLPLADGSVFTLTAQADRIDVHEGRAAVVDFKTGRAPTPKEVRVGFAPQLTLEAAMAELGAFPDLPEGLKVVEVAYGKFGPGGLDHKPVEWKDADLATVVADHMEGLVTLLGTFRNPAVGYIARPFPQFAGRFSAYDHLARVKEWSAGGLDAEEA